MVYKGISLLTGHASRYRGAPTLTAHFFQKTKSDPEKLLKMKESIIIVILSMDRTAYEYKAEKCNSHAMTD